MTYAPRHKKQHRRFHRNQKARKVYEQGAVLTQIALAVYLYISYLRNFDSRNTAITVIIGSPIFWLVSVIAIAGYKARREAEAGA